MNTEGRRKRIIDTLMNSHEPIIGSELARLFGVSRQVIVQDMAVLRAQGINIISTSNGYMIVKKEEGKKNIKTILCWHEGYDAMKEELEIIVDMGGKILDVIVLHPLYGEIRCPLMIGSRYDLDKFMENVLKVKAEPLASLTGGEHIHTIEVKDDKTFDLINEKLKEKGFLVIS